MKSKRGDAEGYGWCVCFERERTLSRIVGDLTVGNRRDEKEATLRGEAYA